MENDRPIRLFVRFQPVIITSERNANAAALRKLSGDLVVSPDEDIVVGLQENAEAYAERLNAVENGLGIGKLSHQREREREGGRERERQRQTGRQTDKQRQTDRRRNFYSRSWLAR